MRAGTNSRLIMDYEQLEHRTGEVHVVLMIYDASNDNMYEAYELTLDTPA
jgi:hypothetical protein